MNSYLFHTGLTQYHKASLSSGNPIFYILSIFSHSSQRRFVPLHITLEQIIHSTYFSDLTSVVESIGAALWDAKRLAAYKNDLDCSK